ncbi:MAG: translation initiation factor IF-6 [Euryarchaeota archaeon]|nr:translation initiation factor IF-6 [Euryarchaeota archaeon]MDE1836991.1 translation initiation factor IF-6 [Euryarchaeota archaeon]MDE1881566.1 translation initiation factor IF-6 [Euryarchaeota archaeon]MDE2046367.1 translation initiation factor IF-6 [Thermoplasmata archaeon]
MPVGKLSFSGSPYLGVYLRVGEKIAVVPPTCPGELVRASEHTLGVKVIRSRIADSELVGSLLAMNDHGAVISEELTPAERGRLEESFRVTVVRSRLNALGNIVLANNRGAVCHPEFTANERRHLSDALGVTVVPSTVAGLGTVAMAAAATDRGAVIHPRATPKELETIEGALGVPVHRSTANFGVPLVGACLVANSRGFIVGDPTTPVEMVHLQEGLKIFD